MKSTQHLLTCLLVALAARHVSGRVAGNLDVFEFGQNTGRVSFTASGSMPGGVKVKDVKVLIPTCTDLKYVRVDVNTDYGGPPAVIFNWHTQVVTLEYDHPTWSKTTYTITAKTVPNPQCLALAGSGKQSLAPVVRSDE